MPDSTCTCGFDRTGLLLRSRPRNITTVPGRPCSNSAHATARSAMLAVLLLQMLLQMPLPLLLPITLCLPVATTALSTTTTTLRPAAATTTMMCGAIRPTSTRTRLATTTTTTTTTTALSESTATALERPGEAASTTTTTTALKASDLSESERERAALLNKHLQTLLLSTTTKLIMVPNDSNCDQRNNNERNNSQQPSLVRTIDIMNAALRWASQTTDEDEDKDDDDDDETTATTTTPSRFGSPALRTYHAFVASDRYDNDAVLLDGLARKTAKQIHHMIQQRIQRINKNNNNNDNNNKNTLDNYNTTTEKASSATTTTSTANANPPQHFRDKIAHSIAKGERRARERSHRTLRTVCPGCARPFNLCLCDVLSKVRSSNSSSSNHDRDNENENNNNHGNCNGSVPPSELLTGTNIVVLQHPNEFRKKHTSTVPLLKLVLGTEHVRVKVGYEFTREDVLFGSSSSSSSSPNDGGADDSEPNRFQQQHRRPIMLFPGPEATDLDQYIRMIDTTNSSSSSRRNASNQDQAESNGSPSSVVVGNTEPSTTTPSVTTTNTTDAKTERTTLVLIDGTWSEAKRIIRKSPEVLEACQMVQFAFDDDDDDDNDNDNNALGDDPNSNSIPSSTATSKTGGTSRSIYNAMRREPDDHCLSTLEACGAALSLLEGPTRGPAIQSALLEVLSEHVKLHLRNAKVAAKSRHNRDTTSRNEKIRRARDIERAIYGTAIGIGDEGESEDLGRSDEDDHRSSKTSTTGRRSPIEITIADSPARMLSLDFENDDTSATAVVTIRRLTHEDIPLIDDWWENGGDGNAPSSKAITTIARSIEADYFHDIGASLGIVDPDNSKELIACILRYESGPLGILHVRDDQRGKGYGTALVTEATRILIAKQMQMQKQSSRDRNADVAAAVAASTTKANSKDWSPPLTLDCTAFIKDGNAASERVFAKAGWVRENPNAKKRTGKRRANRKWIFPPPPLPQRTEPYE